VTHRVKWLLIIFSSHVSLYLDTFPSRVIRNSWEVGEGGVDSLSMTLQYGCALAMINIYRCSVRDQRDLGLLFKYLATQTDTLSLHN